MRRNLALAASLGHDAMISARAEKHAVTASLPTGDRAGLETNVPIRMNSGFDPASSKPSKTR